jgi:hypothetical protein
MAFPTQFTLLSSTTAASTTGSANFAAIATKWAVGIILTATNPQTPNPPLSSLTFTCSTDNTNFAPVTAANMRGGWWNFDIPAQYITVQVAGNTGTLVLVAVAEST